MTRETKIWIWFAFYSIVMIIVIAWLVVSINHNIYLDNKVTALKNDTTKLTQKIQEDDKYQALQKTNQELNERLIKIETTQNQYGNNIQYFSIFVTVVIAIAILVVGLFQYFTNKNAILEVTKQQRQIRINQATFTRNQEISNQALDETKKNQEISDNAIEKTKKNQIESKAILDIIQKKQMEVDTILEEQKEYHSEIFQMLSIYNSDLHDKFMSNEENASFSALTKSLLYNLIALKLFDIESDYLIKLWQNYKTEKIQHLDSYFKHYQKHNIISNTTLTSQKIILKNLNKILEYYSFFNGTELTQINQCAEYFKNNISLTTEMK
ncbi:MAG: hypothetical protein HW421_2070 [Ignavibacteria bacterium]|nr:hypothetical protein [Ignavibacteria bacterium]